MQESINKHIDIFIESAQLLSFTQVAHQRGLTRAQVSKRIAQLEAQLGVSLFYRSTRKMHLTSAGQYFYQSIVPFYQQVKESVASIRNEVMLAEGTIRLNVPFSFGLSQMVACIAAFNKIHPNIKIDLVLGSFYEQALAGSFDIAIIVKDSLLSKRPHIKIGSRTTKICVSPHYIEQLGCPGSPQELTQHQCLVYANPGEQRNNWFFVNAHNKIKVKVSGPLQVNSSSALLQAALCGVGIAKLPSFLVNPYLQDGRLVALFTEYNRKENGIYAVFSSGKDISVRNRLLIEFMQQYFKNRQ